jgi:hypothetical protein
MKKLDPLKNISKIDFQIDDTVDLTHVSPFADVEDSASYINELRKNTWRNGNRSGGKRINEEKINFSLKT